MSSSKLTAAQLSHCWHQYHKNKSDKLYRDRLINHYDFLAGNTAYRASKYVQVKDVEDLSSVAKQHLIRAIDDYDPNKNIKFETFAISVIKYALIKHIRSQGWIPRRDMELCSKVNKFTLLYIAEHNQKPSNIECAAAIGVPEKKIEEIQVADCNQRIDSIDCFENDENCVGLTNDFSSGIIDNCNIDALKKVCDKLPERWNYVIQEHFYNEKTVTEISQQMNISTTRVAAIRDMALERLLKLIKQDGRESASVYETLDSHSLSDFWRLHSCV